MPTKINESIIQTLPKTKIKRENENEAALLPVAFPSS